MSLSSQTNNAFTGRVILGMDTPGPEEMTVQEMEGKRKLVWDESTNRELLKRIRIKAQLKTKELLSQAMAEARQIRRSAHEAGLSQGLAEGQQQLEEHLQNISKGLGHVILSIQNQADTVWETRKADFVRLIRMCVEKVIGIEIAQRRVEILEALLDESVARIESNRFFFIRTSPADTEVIEDLLVRAQAEHPKLSKWKIKADPNITAGVVIESADAKVENSVESRFEGVEAILDQLTVYGPENSEATETP